MSPKRTSHVKTDRPAAVTGGATPDWKELAATAFQRTNNDVRCVSNARCDDDLSRGPILAGDNPNEFAQSLQSSRTTVSALTKRSAANGCLPSSSVKYASSFSGSADYGQFVRPSADRLS